jgi:hypothetical protein
MTDFSILDTVDANLSTNQVGIIEFAESSDYCNKILYPRQRVLLKLIFLEEMEGWEEDILTDWINGRGWTAPNGATTEVELSPQIRERRDYLRSMAFPHFREICFIGGRRSSKGFVTGIAMAKVLYDALQLQDPGAHYGIDTEKDIYASCVAASEDQAKKYQFADLSSTIETCRGFQKHIAKSLETEIRIKTAADERKVAAMRAAGAKVDKDYARLRGVALASNAGTVRGSATIALCIDEMAHMLEGGSKASAEEVYGAATPALKQFKQDAIIFCNSSPYSKVGEFFERYNEGMALREDGTPKNSMMMAFRFPSWGLYENYHQDGPSDRIRHTRAHVPSPDWDAEERNEDGSYYFNTEDRVGILIEQSDREKNPEKYKVEAYARFAEVVDAYLNATMVERVFAGRPKILEEVLVYEPYFEDPVGLTSRNIHRYKAHLDPSSTTAGFGFAMGHLEEFTDPDGAIYDHVVFDIIKRWNPATFPGHTIVWETVIDEVYGYIDLFRPFEVSMDHYQTMDPSQRLRTLVAPLGDSIQVVVKQPTNESNWNRAETFKTAINLGLVHAPNNTDDHELAANELKFLQQQNTAGRWPKVEKQDIGPVTTKDMADCMMEVVWTLLGNRVLAEMRRNLSENAVAAGAQGGYPLGGRGSHLSNVGRNDNLGAFYPGARGGEQRIPSGARAMLDGRVSPTRAARPLRTTRGRRRAGF